MQNTARETIELSVRGEASDGETLSLEHLDVDTLPKLINQWQAIVGRDVKEPISLQTGSIRIKCNLLATVAAPILSDLEHYQRGELDAISDPDRKRALVAMAAEAKRTNREYLIASGGREYLHVDKRSYKTKKRARLVDMELQLEGTVTDAGGQGAQPNIHLETTRGMRIVSASREQLAAISTNILYKRVLMAVTCKYDLLTNTQRDFTLKHIEEIDSSVDEEALAEAIALGSTAWRGIDDPSAWVAELRGD